MLDEWFLRVTMLKDNFGQFALRVSPGLDISLGGDIVFLITARKMVSKGGIVDRGMGLKGGRPRTVKSMDS